MLRTLTVAVNLVFEAVMAAALVSIAFSLRKKSKEK